MGCGTGMVKYLVFIANFVFVLAGLCLMTIGGIAKFNYMEQVKVDGIPPEFNTAALLFIIVGAVVFIIAFFGCCGAIRESSCMLTTYAIILLLIFIIQVAIGVFVFLNIKDGQDFRSQIQKGVQKAKDEYSHRPDARNGMDALQGFLHCCGVNGPQDWNWGNGTVPSSCCGSAVPCQYPSQKVYSAGCAEELYDFLKRMGKTLGYVVIGIAVTEIVGALFGLCLASSIRNHYRRNIYA